MDLTTYRASSPEQQRTTDILRLIPTDGKNALDVGARDGHFSLLMADRYESVTALDLTEPNVSHPRVKCLQGNASKMPFPDKSFDFVLCAEVLEHIPESLLHNVCCEIERVASHRILIGVPYRQDIRVGRTTCYTCGKVNPPWGHVNSFDEQRIMSLFRHCKVESISFVGLNAQRTNWLSAGLMDFAGNPYGTYYQQEPCIYCGHSLLPSPKRNFSQRIATKFAIWLRNASELFARPKGNWIHIVFSKVGGEQSDIPGRFSTHSPDDL